MTTDVLVIRTGSANLASVQAGLRRAGGRPELTEDPAAVSAASHVVLPGVGALGPARARLDALGLSEAVVERARQDRPLFCVCLGLQLLLEESEESPGVPGLAAVSGRAERFAAEVRVPQLGWNRVEAPEGARYLESGEYYFANSYRLVSEPPGVAVARAEHGGAFVAAFERGALLACQFHPELSGGAGHRVIARWLERSAGPS
jgi:imidazole glycerol phosphate synthase glutamine amidotransferase subunit